MDKIMYLKKLKMVQSNGPLKKKKKSKENKDKSKFLLEI